MEELNAISLERLQYVSDYYKLMVQLENYLRSARSNILKARAARGIALSSTFNVGLQSMEPNRRVEHNEGKFVLVDEAEANSEEDENRPKVRKRKESENCEQDNENDKPKVKQYPNFRPFGVLEPLSAKEARKSMHSALEVICELATLQCEIKRIDSRALVIKDSLDVNDELSQNLERVLKV